MASGASRIMTGAFYGTGAALNVRTVGFRPSKVELLNIGGVATGQWVKGMADASVMKAVTAGTISVATTGGITPLSNGFTLGDDSDLNVDGELVRYIAYE